MTDVSPHAIKRSLAVALFLVLTCGCHQGGAQARKRTSAKPANKANAPGASAIKNIFWQPNDLKQGSVAYFTVELTKPATRVTGSFAGKSLTFFKDNDPKLWHALAGDDLETQPGNYDLSVTANLAGGRSSHDAKKVDIAGGTFKTGDIDVPDNFVNPSDEMKRSGRSRAMKRGRPAPTRTTHRRSCGLAILKSQWQHPRPTALEKAAS